MPSQPISPPAATAIARATEALVVAADALAAALDDAPDDGSAQPSARAWLTTALKAVAIAHDAANAAAR